MGGRADGRELAWFVGLVVLLLVVLVWPYAVDGYRFGVGPDVPVYLWWTRVGASEGLSAIGSRPGAPALAAALAGTLDLDAATVTAALASALGVAAGAAAAALVRAAGSRQARAWLLAGLLAGVFSVHLVAGYVANLILAVCFLAAAACLAGGRRSWWAGALLLAGGGLAHLPFLVHAVVVLLGAAALALRAGARDEARDVALASTAGGLVAGAGVLLTLAGPGPIPAETSKDGFLRRAGLEASLVDAYRERFRLRAARYVQWVSIPLAIPGVLFAGGFLRRFLASWLIVMATAIPVGWLTGWFPPDRIVAFGFAVPIAAAFGLLWVHARLGRRPWLAWLVLLFAMTWMVGGALVAWFRQEPFVSHGEAQSFARVKMFFDVDPDTSIVFPVDDGDATSTFLAARVANLARAALPAERAADVYVFVGTVTDLFEGRPTIRGDPEFDALSRLTLDSIPNRTDAEVIVVPAFYRPRDAASHPRLETIGGGTFTTIDYCCTPGEDQDEPLAFEPSPGLAILGASVAILAMLTVLGLAYALASFDDVQTAIATAPAFGAATLTIAAVVLDRVGLRLLGSGVAFGASALAGIGGLAVFLVVQRRRKRQPST